MNEADRAILRAAGVKVLAIVLPDAVKPKRDRKAKYTRHEKGDRNKLEAKYEAHLAILKAAGEIYDFDFEPEKFRLANAGDACYLTPDFRVLLNDGTVEFHDTKGFMEEDANIKIKWFVQQHPYPLVIVRWVKGAWHFERREP